MSLKLVETKIVSTFVNRFKFSCRKVIIKLRREIENRVIRYYKRLNQSTEGGSLLVIRLYLCLGIVI